VDQLDDQNGGRRLEWLPVTGLSSHVRIVVSTLPDHSEFDCLSRLRATLDVEEGAQCPGKLMELEATLEWRTVLGHILKVLGRQITNEQMPFHDDRLEAEHDKAVTSDSWLRRPRDRAL
ncbi:hypothetical protein T484DRAFT_1843041, partial [Baffinella frigidus]